MKHLKGTICFLEYSSKYKVQIILLFLTSIVISGISLLPPLILGAIVDLISGTSLRGFKLLMSKLISGNANILLLVFTFASIFYYVLNSFYGYNVSNLGNQMIEDLRSMLFSNMVNSNNLKQITKGDLISIVMNDTEAVNRVFVGPMNGLLVQVLRMVFTMIIFLLWNWRLAMITIVFIPIVVYLSNRISKIAKSLALEERQQFGAITNNLGIAIENLHLIKNLKGESHETRNFQNSISKIYQARWKLNFEFLKYWPLVTTIQQIAVFLVLLTSLHFIGNRLDASDLMVIYLYLNHIFDPLITISRFANDIYQADSSLERIFHFAKQANNKVVDSEIHFLRHLKFESANIGYNETSVIDNLNFEACEGQIVVLVGKSGVGKSTLINLFSDISCLLCGKIYVNDSIADMDDIKPMTRISHSHPYLFNRSLTENLIYPEARCLNNEEMELIIDLGLNELYEKTLSIENILDYESNISSGEKRRVSLFRTIHTQSQLYLFDEPTAELDDCNRQKVIACIQRLNGIRIIATHDETLMGLADVVVKL